MYIEYPHNTGVLLSAEHLDTISLQNLIKKLPAECIIHLYGMHFSGISSVGNKLSYLLRATLIDRGLIVKVIAYQILENKKWYDNHIFQPYFEDLSFQKNNIQLVPIVHGKSISIAVLKSNRIEQLTRKLVLDTKFINHLNNYIGEALTELVGTRTIVVDNSAMSNYLSDTELGQRQVLHILFTSSLDTMRSRFLETMLSEYKQMKTDFEPTSDIYQSIEQEFTKRVLIKNEELLEQILAGDEGMIVQDGYIINTNFMSLDTAAGTVLKAIEFAYIL